MRSLYFKIFLWFWLAMALVGVAFVVSTVTLQNNEADERWREFVSAGLSVSGQSAIEIYQTRGADSLAEYFDRMDRRNEVRAYLYDDGLNELSGSVAPEAGMPLVERALGSDDLAVEQFEQSRLVALRLTAMSGETFVLLADMEWPFRGRGGGGRSPDRSDGNGGSRADSGPLDERSDGRGDVTDDDAERRGDGGSGGRRGGFRGRPRTSPSWYSVWWSAIDDPGALAVRMGFILVTAGLLCFGLARYLTAPVASLREATHRFAEGDLSARVGASSSARRDELTELGNDFDVMAERIESLLTTQRQLLSDVSHELRSPLARLNVALALARQKAGEDAAVPLDRIESEAEQLNALIGRVLALARFESGATRPDFVNVDLASLVADVVADADFEADPKGTAVRVVDSAPVTVKGDEPLLRSAVENVVRNAVRYTNPGTDVEVALQAAGTSDEPQVVVTVRDHGPGVPDEHLEGLFEPFYRIADARDRESGGTGLGLSITDRAIRLHDGEVKASNAEGGGLVVEMRLPRVG